MLKSTIKYRVTAYRFELWGNLKDGFDINNQYQCSWVAQNFLKFPTQRQITMVAKDAFEGLGFALNEGKTVFIPRNSIKPDDAYNNNFSITDEIYFEYRGQQIGFVRIEEITVFPKHYIARIMCARLQNPNYLTTEPSANKETALKQAKALATENALTRIELDTVDGGRVVDTVDYEWRNKGDEFIGVHGNIAAASGWFNLSK